MPSRWGLGPVFQYESLINARRWQVYALRALFVLALLVGMFIVWDNIGLSGDPAATPGGLRALAQVGQNFFYAITGIQITVVLLAAPAATAGAVCLDKARGTLTHVLVTDLSDVEIVLGKLAARLAPVFGLIACGVPVTALAFLLGGIDPGALLGAFLVTMALAILGCTLAFTISVWAAKTHEVLMAVYLIWFGWLLSLPLWWGMHHEAGWIAPPDWFQKANVYVLALSPYIEPDVSHVANFAGFLAVTLGLSAVLIVVDILRLRAVAVGQAGRPGAERRPSRWETRRLFPWWPSPSLDGNPVLWREWHGNRPSRLGRILWGVYVCGAILGTAWGVGTVWAYGTTGRESNLFTPLVLQTFFGALLLSASAPTALAEERARGSLDVLLATPLSTRSIVLGKWLGAFRVVLLLAILPTLILVTAAVRFPTHSNWPANAWPKPVPLDLEDRLLAPLLGVGALLASGALLTSLGLALATWVRRLSRAVTLSVIFYLAIAIGVPVLAETVLMRIVTPQKYFENVWISQGISSVSPMTGALSPIQMLHGYIPGRKPFWWLQTACILATLSGAAMLLGATILTFNRCMGRVDESVLVLGPPELKPIPSLVAQEVL